MTNPLLARWDTPFGVPPFAEIDESHYEPAFEAAFEAHDKEIEAIASSADAPTFDNTVVALERAGSSLERVGAVFFNLTSTDTSEALQDIEARIMPRYANHMSSLYTNQRLFERVRQVYSQRNALAIEQDGVPGSDRRELLEELHRRFVRAGAALSDADRQQVATIDEQLASLQTRFGRNVLADTNGFELLIEEDADVSGLPGSVLEAARAAAESKGKSGYLFTISRSSITPFLQFADNRELREKIYRAYVRCADNDNDANNREVLRDIARLRARRAKIMDFGSHAEFMMDDRMARTPARVRELLDNIWRPASRRVAEEAAALQDRIRADGGNFALAPWDWQYYTEKTRSERFGLQDEQVKPFFLLEHVRDGAFEVAKRLYGVSFEAVDVPVYHPDVEAYRVVDADGTFIGIFLTDYYMRDSKRGGAWMSHFREQSNLDESIRPIVINCCNFPKASPCLLGMDEVRTLFHEFGHGLHGLLSNVIYPSQSGTNVKQDFVELPSQIMEHWAMEPEVLRGYARHHVTGKVIADEVIEKLRAAETFNQGFATTEYLAACYLDMAWHSIEEADCPTVSDLERTAMESIGLIDAVDPRYKSTYFQHIFTGDSYSAGYYSYIWAEVLDADGFEAFREKGLFDQDTALSFRRNVLEKGATEDPMVLYRRFRGRDPEVGPLLASRGLTEDQ